MALVRATYVKSLNGYQGTRPFMGVNGVVYSPAFIPDGSGNVKVMLEPEKTVVLDANDIYITGSSGTKLPAKAQAIAQNVQMLEMQELSEPGRFRIRIGNYNLSMTS